MLTLKLQYGESFLDSDFTHDGRIQICLWDKADFLVILVSWKHTISAWRCSKQAWIRGIVKNSRTGWEWGNISREKLPFALRLTSKSSRSFHGLYWLIVRIPFTFQETILISVCRRASVRWFVGWKLFEETLRTINAWCWSDLSPIQIFEWNQINKVG